MLSVSRTRPAECAIHYILPARLAPRLRVTSPQLPSFGSEPLPHRSATYVFLV